MKLICVGSGSKGNSYVLDDGYEALILEAGMPFKTVKPYLDFDISRIVGVIAGHEHKDHSGYIREYEQAGIRTYKPYLKEEPQSVMRGHFYIMPVPLVHDVPCFGFMIIHPSFGKLVYICDTEYCAYTFKNVNVIICEANYSKDLLLSGDNDKFVRDRIFTTHMELQTCLEFLKVNKSPALRQVVLCHLSQSGNADSKIFKSEAERVVDCPVCVAEPNTEITLDEVPF